MLTPELQRRIRQIELHTNQLVHNVFAGAYQSAYKGRGLSFSTVRPYIPGDDVRTIDWKVTARTNEPYIKEFTEERELTLMLVIDGSASVIFGTQDRLKRDFAAELAAVLAYAANINNDKAGLLIFSDHIEHYVPPKKGRNHILRLIRDVLTHETQGTGTDLATALRTVNRTLKRGALLFMLSDFLLPADSFRRELILSGRKHNAHAIILSDPLEEAIPNVGMMRLRDAETGDVQWVDTRSENWQAHFQQQRQTIVAERTKALQAANVAEIAVPPDGDYVRALARFFQQQGQRRR